MQVALNTRQKLAVPLIEKEVLSKDSRRFRFGLPTKDHKLGLPVGKHFFVSGRWNGEFVMRPYTPVTGDEVTGYVDLVIKASFVLLCACVCVCESHRSPACFLNALQRFE